MVGKVGGRVVHEGMESVQINTNIAAAVVAVDDDNDNDDD